MPVGVLLAVSHCPDLGKPRWESIGAQNEVGDRGRTGHATVERYEVPLSAFSARDHFVSIVFLSVF